MRLKATGAAYIKSGQTLVCPRCNSKQNKSFSLMPKKFPRPEEKLSEIFNSDAFNKRVFRWENSYQCQKCSNEFVALFEDDYQDINNTQEPKKKKGFIRSLFSLVFKLALFAIIVVLVVSILIAYDQGFFGK